jgi:hypothetical protein
MAVQQISLNEAEALFDRKMGLIYGPGITTAGAFYPDLVKKLQLDPPGNTEVSYVRAVQHELDKGVELNALKQKITDHLHARRLFPGIKRIANLKWAAILSLALDNSFEAEVAQACQKRASGYTSTQVITLPCVLGNKTIPIFKLLGISDSSDFVSSETSYAVRRAKWRHAIQDFASFVKEGPVICLGLHGCRQFVSDLLAQIISDSRTRVSPLLFAASEFDARSQQEITELVEGQTRVMFITAALPDLVGRMRSAEDAGHTPLLLAPKTNAAAVKYTEFEDIAVVVNTRLHSRVGPEEKIRLLDLLFSPNLPQWDPFFHNLDVKRQIGTQIVDSLIKPIPSTPHLPAFVIIGSAASGKTTVAKRVAYDLASRGHLVVWFRRTFFPNIEGLLSDLCVAHPFHVRHVHRVLCRQCNSTNQYQAAQAAGPSF